MYKDIIWCLNCGLSVYVKDGFTKDKRQRIKCCFCGTRTTIKAMKQGEKLPVNNSLLPFLLKNNSDLNKGELYSLGFLVADGNINLTKSVRLQLNILQRDIEVAEIIKRELQIPNKILLYTRSDTGQEVLSLNWQNKYAWGPFLLKGLNAQKTGNEIWLPHMRSPHFVRGLFDGDGCIFINTEKHKYELSFTCGNKQFLEDLNNYFYEILGVKASKVATQRNKTGNCYRITIYKKSLLVLCEWMYKDSEGLRLERKYNKYLEIKNSVK